MRLELGLVALFFVSWLVGLLQYFGWLPVSGSFSLGLRGLFAFAAALGWVAGNVYVHRSRGLPRLLRRRLVLIYLFGPPGLLFLLRSLAPKALLAAAPLASLYATLVFSIFFLVPVSLKGAFRPSP